MQDPTQPRPSATATRRRNKVARLLARDGHLCRWCDQPFTDDRPPTLDHVIPRKHGGLSHDGNLVLACARCNNERHHHARCASCGDKVRRGGIAWARSAWHRHCLAPLQPAIFGVS